MPRPSHSTVVAYLALFIALCTGVSFAATKITSSKQIKRGVVNSGDIKDNSLQDKDVKEGALTGNALADGSVSGADLADGSVGTADVRNNSLSGADVLDGGLSGLDLGPRSVGAAKIAANSLTGEEIDESTLDLARGFNAFQAGSVSVDNGSGSGIPRSPEGSVVAIALPPGRYLMLAHAAISSDDNGGGVYCLFGGDGEFVETGNDVSSVGFGDIPSTPAGISVSTIRESDVSFITRLICSDADSGVTANDRGIEAVSLRE